MNILIVISCFTLVYVSANPVEVSYKSKFEDMDVEAILNSARLLKNYGDCLLDRGNCPPPAKELKDHLGDALKTNCSKCNEKQKAIGTKTIDFLMKNKPDLWAELQEKYDPEGIYVAKWQAQNESEKNKEEESQPSQLKEP